MKKIIPAPLPMSYYGTSLRDSGHYFHEVAHDHILQIGYRNPGVPFDPEYLVATHIKHGEVRYLNVEGYAICAIAGSCSDTRPGSKSVFWVKADMDPRGLKELILATPICKQIIEQMPFEVNW